MLVELIAHTNDPERTIAAAAKLCYSDAHIDTLAGGPDPEKTAAFCKSFRISAMPAQLSTPASPSASRACPAPSWHRSPATASAASAYRASAMSGSTISAMSFPPEIEAIP